MTHGDAEPARSDHAAIRSLPYLASALDLVTDLAFVISPEWRVVFANEACRRRAIAPSADPVGLSPGELVGCASAATEPESCRTGAGCADCGLASIVHRAAEIGVAAGSSSVRLPHGHAMDLDVRAMAIETPDGRSHVLCVTRDRSEEHWQRQLDRSFFHDALDIASGILGLAELGDAGAADDDDADALEGLARELVEMIRAQRTLKAAEAGDLAIDVTAVDLASIAGTAVEVNERLAAERSVRAERDTPLPVVVMTDRNLLTRVVSNLVRNAIEASAAGDVVTVRTGRADAERAEISVHNPAEIPPEVRSRIFRRPASTKGAHRGTGAFSARLLTERYLGGSIHFVTGPELGTTFFLQVPVEHASETDREAEA